MPSDCLTFLHLSDIHFHRWSGDSYDLDRDVRSQLEIDAERIGASIGKELNGILVTGDIAFFGTENEYQTAYEWLTDLCGVLGVDVHVDVWMTPGNHDFDRSLLKSKQLQELHATLLSTPPEAIAEALQSLCRDPISGPGLFLPLSNYNTFAKKFGCDIGHKRAYWRTEGLFELKDGPEIRLQGMNSVLVSSELDKAADDSGPGSMVLGEFQIPIAKKGVEYISLCHHPLHWLRDQSAVSTLIDKRARIQLFGHEHDHQVTHDNSSMKLLAGAVHPHRGDDDSMPTYNYFQVHVETNEKVKELVVSVHPRVWNENDRTFVSGFPEGKEADSIRFIISDTPDEIGPRVDEETKQMNEKFAKNSVEPSSKTTRMREATHLYYCLSYYHQIRIARDLDVWSDEFEGEPELSVSKEILHRVHDRGLTDALIAKIKEIG